MEQRDDVLAELNAPQRKAVTTTAGPVLVLAGPGSGKTRVITHRIAYLVQHEGVRPWNILAVTFTNKAARELRERLERLVGASAAKEMTIGTFHAICVRVLRVEEDFLATQGLNRSFVILDADDQTDIVKQSLKATNLDDKQFKPAFLQAMISRAKNAMQGPKHMAEHAETYLDQVLAQVYPAYQQLLRGNNAVDFDDLLLLAVSLWQRAPEVLRRYQQRWRFLHVDEFQDCNLPQYLLLRQLAYGTDERHEGLGNICVVGDDDQMIYTWRGASAENIARFERDFPHTHLILLEQNYRSTQTILDAAQGVVQRNRLRKAKALWTAQGLGEKIVYHEAYDEEAEGLFVVRELTRLLSCGAVGKRGEVAVMYRTNAQSRILEEQFLRARVPYRVIGSRRFYERKEIKDLLAYLRLLVNPRDDLSLRRIINVPNRKVGPKTLGSLQLWASMQGLPIYDALLQIEAHPTLGSSAKAALVDFRRLVVELAQDVESAQLPDLLDRIVERSGYGAELRKQAGEELDRWANVVELRRVAEDYAQVETHTALELFLENVALMGGADTTQTGVNGTIVRGEQEDAVTLITLHAAKGLEYPVVFIVGMDEGCLPHARAADNPEQLEEERRLAYVGFTRAKRRLILVRAVRRAFFGEYQTTMPSRFLSDVPLALVTGSEQDDAPAPAQPGEGGGGVGERSANSHQQVALPHHPLSATRGGGNEQDVLSSSPASREGGASPGAPPPLQYAPGERVRHARYGEGVVLSSERVDNTLFVEVHFQGDVGNKRLSMDFARLEKL